MPANEGRRPTRQQSIDRCFKLLANHQRRSMLVLLREHGRIDLIRLARELARRERDPSEAAVTDRELDAVLVVLRHNHLPRLEDAGVIDYDRESHTVHYVGSDYLDALLEFTASIEC